MSKRWPGALFLVCVTAQASAALRYELAYEPVNESMRVSVCGAEAASRRVFRLDWGADAFIDEARRKSGKPLDAQRSGFVAPDWEADDCLTYRAAIGRIADQQKEDVGWRVKIVGSPNDSDLVVSAQQWLVDTAHENAAEAHAAMPSGYSFSAPWAMTPTANEFRIAPSPRDWATNIAIGRFALKNIAAGTDTVHLGLVGIRDTATQEKLTAWIRGVAHAALSAYGSLPLPSVQVLTLPVGSHSSAVIFGQSSRGQGHGLTLLIDPSHPLSEFNDDWTAVHEFSHLFHPYLGDEGRWLAEGLATYWQNVLRARAAMLTAPQAWGRLETGFVRGRAATREGQPLGGKGGDRGFGRIYWAGAAFWLAVDTQLRAESAGKNTIDLALRRFRDCCFAPAREWPPEDFMAKLDALLGTQVFVPRYREAMAQTTFPDLRPVYARLGIAKDAEGALHFDDAAPAAAARKAIMAMPSP